MDFTITNKAMQPMAGFAIQLNKNSFGVAPAGALQVVTPLPPGQTHETSVPLNTNGVVQRMEPLNNLQVPNWGPPRVLTFGNKILTCICL